MSRRAGCGNKGEKVSEAVLSAEALFESKAIAEIREIEARTRKDIERKKREIRNLVGGSYKDLITSADKIVALADNVSSILDNISGIQDGFSTLFRSFSAGDSRSLGREASLATKHAELYAVGARVKFLVDTPEVVWGCLDARQHLQAARRFLQAELVHSQLPASFPAATLGRFPLLRSQWPLVQKFREQIAEAALGSLGAEGELASGQAVDALLALALLREQGSAAALATFLQGRREWIARQLAQQRSGQEAAGASGCAALLSGVTATLQTAVSQVGELFLPPHRPGGTAADGACALRAGLLADELQGTELLFGMRQRSGGEGEAGPERGASSEAASWAALTRAAAERLEALAGGQVEQVCNAWLQEVAATAGAHCPALLASCSSAQELLQVEASVKVAYVSWQHPGMRAGGGGGGGQAAAAAPPSTTAMTPAGRSMAAAGAAIRMAGPGGAQALGAAGGPSRLSSWDAVCDWVLGRPCNVWLEVWHGPWLHRAQQLLAATLAAAEASLQAALADMLAAAASGAAAGAVEPAGAVQLPGWPAFGDDVAATATTATSGGAAPSNPSAGGTPRAGLQGRQASESAWAGHAFRLQADRLVAALDGEVCSVLQDTLLLVHGLAPGEQGLLAGAGGWGRPAPGLTDRSMATSADAVNAVALLAQKLGAAASASGAGREALAGVSTKASELQPYLQSKCSELAVALAGALQSRLSSLPQPAEGAAGAVAAEQALLLARCCSALAASSKHLQLAMAPADNWKAALTAGAGGSGGGSQARQAVSRMAAASRAAAAASNPKLAGLRDRFASISALAYGQWARWAAASLAASLRASLHADPSLGSPTPPLSWAETVITAAGDSAVTGLDDPGADAMRFHLPCFPSPGLSACLAAACQEVRRAGDHTVALQALQALQWELGTCLLDAYGGCLQEQRLSDKGVLQLLMDVRLARDVLAGGRPVAALAAAPGDQPTAAAALAATNGELAHSAALAGRKRAFAALEAQLAERLDPIDWATYEPYLWSAVAQHYQRTRLLHGLLLSQQRPLPQEEAAAAGGYGKGALAAQELNPLAVLPLVPRFQALPISAPQAGAASSLAAAAAASSRKQPGHAGAAALPGMASAAAGGSKPAGSDLASDYSFADLHTSRGSSHGVGMAGGAAAAPTAGALPGSSASSSSSALGALQAKFQAGSLSLGSILGDRAADLTAMAQQHFENIGASGSAMSLLSSLVTKGAAKR